MRRRRTSHNIRPQVLDVSKYTGCRDVAGVGLYEDSVLLLVLFLVPFQL